MAVSSVIVSNRGLATIVDLDFPLANSFGAAWFDADMRPNLVSPEWYAAVTAYVDLLSTFGPPGSEGNSFIEILSLYNECKCGLLTDATLADSFFDAHSLAS